MNHQTVSAPEEAYESGFWVFAYGSLMWRPDFEFVEQRPATLHGFARRFCMWSITYRGTPEAPGLVLALLESSGAATQGLAYRVGADDARRTLAYLRDRELTDSAYREVSARLRFSDDSAADGLTYVIDSSHPLCAHDLSLEAQADIIAARAGRTGLNRDYLFNTVAQLQRIGVRDAELERLAEIVRAKGSSAC